LKERKLGEISSFVFLERIIIALDKQWCQVFEDQKPKFDAIINNKGHFILVGPRVHWPTKRNQIPAKKVSRI